MGRSVSAVSAYKAVSQQHVSPRAKPLIQWADGGSLGAEWPKERMLDNMSPDQEASEREEWLLIWAAGVPYTCPFRSTVESRAM